jgi:hypothetical protein
MTRRSTVILDGGWSTTSEAEHALHETTARLGLRARLACTEFRRAPNRVVVLLELDGPPPADLATQPDLTVELAEDGVEAGRAFVFPGSEALTGVITVGDLLARTAVDEVLRMGGVPVDPETELETQDFVRPVFRDGRLVLHTRPGAGPAVLPFEQPNPTPCCAEHR